VRDAVRIPMYGCDCYAYGLLAAGLCDLVVEADLKPYDYMALVPIIQVRALRPPGARAWLCRRLLGMGPRSAARCECEARVARCVRAGAGGAAGEQHHRARRLLR
jgi:hypothetical protein